MLSKGNYAHYEKGMEGILRSSNINYISTDERKKGLLRNGKKVKNFDVLINSKKTLIIDFKGKQFSYPGAIGNTWENWLSTNHVKDLLQWKSVFKASRCNVTPLLVFVYQLKRNEDRANFQDIYRYKGIDYGVVAIPPCLYLRHSKSRGTNKINVSRKKFQTLVKPLSYYISDLKFN